MKNYNITKKVFRYFSISLLLAGIVIVTNSCETGELELLNDPSRLRPEQASEDLFINSIQLGLANFFDSDTQDNFVGASEFGMQVTRMTTMNGGNAYENAYTPAGMNGMYQDAYSKTMIDIRTLYPLAEEKGLWTHVAMAQVIEAYVMMTLVDYFGDFPYSEAFQGAENIAPKLDAGEDIYAAAEQLLLDAVANFKKQESATPETDFYFDKITLNGNLVVDESKWIKLANTLRLKLYVQTRLVDGNAGSKINNILTGSDGYISTAADDFQFNYTTTDVNPDSRHPLFGANYDNGKTDYMANNFMSRLVNQVDITDAAISDPRRRYYIYRQDLNFNAADSQTQPCTQETKPTHYSDDDPFCQVTSNLSASGYWGRDHGDDDGIPPDDARVALFGVYPVGGPFDDNGGATQNNRNTGLRGAGSSMIMLSSYVDFMLAESANQGIIGGDARMFLENGIRKSINKVLTFGDQLTPRTSIFTPDDPDTAADETETLAEAFDLEQTDIDAYVNAILAKYDNAANSDEELDVIVEQYYLALWGNGVESYNTYRRTGKPDLQPTLLPAPGIFIRTFPYPDALVNRNSNVNTKPISTQVFWDTNPGNFID